jgi:hypothetical protein
MIMLTQDGVVLLSFVAGLLIAAALAFSGAAAALWREARLTRRALDAFNATHRCDCSCHDEDDAEDDTLDPPAVESSDPDVNASLGGPQAP